MKTLFQGDTLTPDVTPPEGAELRIVGPVAVGDVEVPFDTSELPAGRYRLLIRHEGATTVEHFRVLGVDADPAASPEAIIAAIDATIMGSATANQQSVTIAGRSLSRYSLSELATLRTYYARVLRSRGRRQPARNHEVL